jgi:hypothetical protein
VELLREVSVKPILVLSLASLNPRSPKRLARNDFSSSGRPLRFGPGFSLLRENVLSSRLTHSLKICKFKTGVTFLFWRKRGRAHKANYAPCDPEIGPKGKMKSRRFPASAMT